jgi:uncharacterized protein
MDLATAQDVIAYEFTNSSYFDELQFDLFGGEPALRKDFVVEVVEWTISQKFEKPFIFFLQTNGTLIHGDFKNWLRSRKEYICAGLSLDGRPETHNRNRSNSYDRIDIDFFRETFPAQGVRMTVPSDSIPELAADVIYLHDLGFRRIEASLAAGYNFNHSDLAKSLQRELRKLCDYYISHPDLPVCSLLDMHLPILLSEKEPRRKWCGTGTDMVSIDVDGNRYPCHTFQPNTNREQVNAFNLDFDRIDDFRDPECTDCLFESLCPTCYGMNYIINGNILARDKQHCQLTKSRAVAVSYLRAQQIASRQLDLTPSNLFQNIEAIQKIQSTLGGSSS